MTDRLAQQDEIRLSHAAVEHIRHSLDKRGKGLGVRFRMKKAGCSGYEYVVEFADQQEPMDLVFASEGVQVFIDPKSHVFLKGSKVDFVRKGLSQDFVFENPNEKARCGCGESSSF